MKTYSQATTNRGFFQMDGVGPGAYIVSATREGYAPARASVRVLDQQTTIVDNPPLMLRPARAIDIYVDPPLPPTGEQWLGELQQVDSHGIGLATLSEGAFSVGQAWRVEGVPVGKHVLTIRTLEDENDTRAGRPAWYSEIHDIRSETSQIFVTVPIVEVTGWLELGADPLPEAKLIFGGRFSAARHTVTTGEGGEFQGWLGRPGLWQIDVRAKDLVIDARVQRDIEDGDHLEISIPDTYLHGQVVTEQGAPARAIVNAYPQLQPNVQIDADRETGAFEAIGLPPGPISLKADAGSMVSDILEIVLEDGVSSPEIQLVVRPTTRQSLQVVAPDGTGVAGARIIALALEDGPAMSSPYHVTDREGRLEMSLSPKARNLKLTVAAPGFAFRMLQAVVQDEITVTLSQESGTLVVELPASFGKGRWGAPYPAVLHSGGHVSVHQLRQWAGIHGHPPESPFVVNVPFMEPGPYSLCWLMHDAAAPADCKSGNLAASGELTLGLSEPD